MPKIDVSVPHKLPTPEALQRIKGLLGQTKAQFAGQISDLTERWDGNIGSFSLKAAGFKVSGKLEVGSGFARVTGDLPFMAGMFKGRIESTLRDEAERCLS